MIINASILNPIPSDFVLTIRCPGCGYLGTFDSLGANDWRLQRETMDVGLRRCPNDSCRALVYFVRSPISSTLLATYPHLRIDFDRTDIPEKILASLEEAISCHSNSCFVASAIMVRKTLDLLCLDRSATGGNLKERISALGKSVLIPIELLTGMDDLRLLGNDAAHVESQIFFDIGQEEIEVAIDFTKEILKAVYQYSSMLKKLQSLKKTP